MHKVYLINIYINIRVLQRIFVSYFISVEIFMHLQHHSFQCIFTHFSVEKLHNTVGITRFWITQNWAHIIELLSDTWVILGKFCFALVSFSKSSSSAHSSDHLQQLLSISWWLLSIDRLSNLYLQLRFPFWALDYLE